jgi:hypothetical protein
MREDTRRGKTRERQINPPDMDILYGMGQDETPKQPIPQTHTYAELRALSIGPAEPNEVAQNT